MSIQPYYTMPISEMSNRSGLNQKDYFYMSLLVLCKT